ncbi:hypothetical protein Q7P36_000839 [Cladosporium allicinum]
MSQHAISLFHRWQAAPYLCTTTQAGRARYVVTPTGRFLPGFNATDTTDSDHPKYRGCLEATAWKGARFCYTYCKADPIPYYLQPLPANSLFLTFQTTPVASCYPKLASVRARPSLRRQTFHLDPRNSVQQAFTSSTAIVFDDRVVNKPSKHQHSKDRHLASLAPESTQPVSGILEFPTNSQPTFHPESINLAAKSRTMRFSTLTAAALFALASAQDAYPAAASDSSLVTTWTMTRTVQRVVETVTATRNTSAITTSAAEDTTTTLASYTTAAPLPLGTASMGVYPQANGTSSVLGTGAGPSSNGSSPIGEFPESGAERVGLQMVGLMAVVGLVGLVGL